MYSVDDLNREIIAAVRKVWDEVEQPLLVSKLGKDYLSDDARAYLREASIPLARHIRGQLTSEIRYLKMPRQGGGAVPYAETQNFSDEELEERYTPKKRRDQAEWIPPLKFYEDLWAAFRDPLENEQRRILHIIEGSRLKVVAQSTDELIPEGAYAIESYDTAITGDTDRRPSAAEVRTAITNWSENNGISLEQLTYSPAPRLNHVRRPFNTGMKDACDDLPSFISILQGLSRDQVLRLSFPGDVMLQILERHVKK